MMPAIVAARRVGAALMIALIRTPSMSTSGSALLVSLRPSQVDALTAVSGTRHSAKKDRNIRAKPTVNVVPTDGSERRRASHGHIHAIGRARASATNGSKTREDSAGAASNSRLPSLDIRGPSRKSDAVELANQN